MAVNLEPGEGFVPGHAAHTARALLAEAEAQGLDPTVVRTTAGGFIVPSSLIEDEDEKADKAKAAAEATAAKKAATKKATATRAASKAATEKKGS